MAEIGVRIKAIADVDEAASKFSALSNAISSDRFGTQQSSGQGNTDSLLSALRNQFLKDTGIGGYSRADEISKKFEAVLNSLESSDKAMNKSMLSGDLEGTKNYAELHTSLRNQFLKDTQLAGYKDVKLDSKPLENAIVNLTAIINQMIAEGKSKEAKEYGNILKGLQGQLSSENNDEQRERLQREQQTRFIRGISRFLGQGQNLIGQAGAGNAVGGALSAAGGATDLFSMIKGLPAPLLAGAGIAAAIVAVGAAANKLSEQWEKVMQPSMGLAASLGELGDDAKKNSAAFKEVFSRATDSNVLHGYKNEEGLQLANELSKMGVRSKNVYQAESQVFGYQRATDADRGLLSRAVGYSQRYRAGENVLGYAYGGLKESGMQSGQYQEYLNATLRVFEEGLSKGVVKGFAEITRTQNMLAQIGDAWKGEAGMERRQNISSAIEGSYHLQSDYDVMMYRAAQAMTGSNDYGVIAKVLDQGIDATDNRGKSILSYYGDVLKETIGEGNRQSGVMTTMKDFNLTYTAAEQLYDAIMSGSIDQAKSILQEPDSKGVQTTEEKLLSTTELIRRDLAEIGTNFIGAKTEVVSGLEKIIGLMAGNKAFASSSVRTMDVMADIGATGERQRNITKAFEKAYKKENQPDLDENGLGDYGENAKRIQDAMEGLPEGAKYFLAQHPNNAIFTTLDRFKKAEDFTPENTQQAIAAIDLVRSVVAAQTPESMRQNYFNEVASSIPQNSNTRKDDELRYILTNYSHLIPDNAMYAIESFRTPSSPGGATISSTDVHGPNTSEVALLIRTLQSFAASIPELADALREASTVVIREER